MKKIALYLILVAVSLSCSKYRGQRVQFEVIPNQPTTIIIQEKPLHYKYSKVEADTIPYQPDKKFGYTNPKSTPRLVNLQFGEVSFPLFLDGKSRLTVIIDRTSLEQPIQIEGYPKGLLELYYDLQKTEKSMQEGLAKQKPLFLEGKSNSYIRILDDIQSNRKSILMNTPYEFMYWASLGELLVAKIDELERSKIPLKERYAYRSNFIEEAKSQAFFSYKSLVSQRAGIRDFTNAWAHSFGIADSVRKALKKDLLIYDVNRTAFDILKKRREEVIVHIEEERAKAYSEMYLVAEQLAEGNFLEGQKSMTRFTQLYLDNFPTYVDWIIEFHNEIQGIQAGNPAFDFSYPDKEGKKHSLSDFKGKIVYLDFWASWCSPCLHEFPYMIDQYKKLDPNKVVYIGIGLDEDIETWKSTINRYQLPWLQLYGGKELKNELFKKYKGGAIPLVVLIDQNGTIASYNDVRASYNLVEKINALLK